MKHYLFITLLVLFISGCASTGYRSPHNQVLELELKQPITVPAGSSFVYIKAPGQVVKPNKIGTYEVYCKFSVPRPKASDELIISPDVFHINNIYRRISGFQHYPYKTQLAFNNGFDALFRHHDASKQDLELFLSLSSVNQPGVKSLSCIRFADPFFGYSPTVADMKQVLGRLARFSHAE